MDTRNYDEPDNCGLEACDCREDNTCGCSFPNNMSDFSCGCTDLGQCGQFSSENLEIKTPETHIKKDTTCFCSNEGCECTIEHSETEH